MTRGKIRRDISSGFPSLSGTAPPLPGWYAELGNPFAAGRKKLLAEVWERYLSVFPYSEFSSSEVGESALIDRQLILQVKFQDLASLSKKEIEDIEGARCGRY